MRLVTIDLETYWDANHSLTKMNPIEYVLHPKTEIQSMAIKFDDGPTIVQFGEEEIRYGMKHSDFSDSIVVGHNLAGFDGMLLAWRLGMKPKMWGDTMAMARPFFGLTTGLSLQKVARALGLGEKGSLLATNTKGKYLKDFTKEEIELMRVYNAQDTELCYGIFNALAPRLGKFEMKLIDMFARMTIQPTLRADRELLQRSYREELARKSTALMLLAGTAGLHCEGMTQQQVEQAMRDVVMSQPKFAELLENLGAVVPMKESGSQVDADGKPKMIPALAKTDKGMTELLEHPDYKVQIAAATRLEVKTTQLETRLATFDLVASYCKGRLPMPNSYCGALITWRSGGSMKMNTSNLPRVKKKYRPSDALRQSIIAPKGKLIVVVDSSNIELRVAHALAGQADTVAKLNAGEDLYCWFASILFGRPINKHDNPKERFVGKVACIAEGELVLTNRGLVPIEKVSKDDAVWDGIEWVSHDGPIYKGEQNVITYQGLTATPDHVVFLSGNKTCTFGEASENKYAIACTGSGRAEIRAVGSYRGGSKTERESVYKRMLRGVWRHMVGVAIEPYNGEINTVQELHDTGATRTKRGVHNNIYGRSSIAETNKFHDSKMQQPKNQWVQRLWSTGDSVLFCISGRSGVLYSALCAEGEIAEGSRVRPPRQQWELREGEHSTGGEGEKHEQHQKDQSSSGRWCASRWDRLVACVSVFASRSSLFGGDIEQPTTPDDGSGNSAEVVGTHMQTKRRVWDLLNAGPRNRFTVSGCLVHNCLSLQYQSGWATFQNMVRVQSDGEMLLDEAECRRTVNLWREMFPMIAAKKTGFWDKCQQAIESMAAGMVTDIDHLGFCSTEFEKIATPAGHWLQYPNLRSHTNARGYKEWKYGEGRNTSRVYGGHLMENLCQHVARNIVMEQTLKLHQTYPVKHSVYDEAVLVVPEADVEVAEAYAVKCFSESPKWWPDLPLACEAGHGQRYSDCK